MSHQIAINTDKPLLRSHRSITEIGEEYFDFVLENDPFYATALGDHRFNDLLPDVSSSARKRASLRLREFRAELLAVNTSMLCEDERLRYDFLSHEIVSSIGAEDCHFPLWTVDQLNGPHISMMEISRNQRLETEHDVEDLLKRYHHIRKFFADHVENLREGKRRGLYASKIAIAHVVEQLDNQLAQTPNASPFMLTSTQLPHAISAEKKTALSVQLETTIAQEVYPALMVYRDFLKHELLPHARDPVGINTLPLPANCYQNLIERYTGLRKSPKILHEEGKEEVSRIKEEIRNLIRSHTDVNDEKYYIAKLKKDPQQFFATRQALIAHNQALVERATRVLPLAFGRLPTTKLEVIPLEDYREKHAPAAYYYEAPSDNTRCAYYYLNTYQPQTRPRYNMAALAFHEAVPGHHLQIALANENTKIPRFQRHLRQTAFVEGWALYAELLSRELKLYHGVEETFGSLNYELWRALRLVVDTGIHHHGWSRDQAIAYLGDNSALSREEVINEIDRYIVWPGQALAYKIGQLEITSLRKLCETTLKEKFSLKNFHDQILKNGALPLTTLRSATMHWLEQQVKLAKAEN